MFMEIDRLQSLVDSENVNQDLITTAEGVCKNVVSHIMDGLSDKDEIQQILYVLQNIGRNVSDFNDLIISKDFQQMKAVLYLKLGCETEKDEDMFMLMEQFLDAVNILSESSAEGKSTFVENWVEIYLDILLQDKSDFRHILEVLKSLNILLEDASSNVKEYLLSRNSVTDYLSRLAAFLNQVGDYEFQVGIAECLFRIIPKKIREQVSSSIFQNQCTRKSFLQIRDNEFETDCRLFLNSLNASLKRSKRVFSLPCNKAWLGDKELYKPDDPNYDTFWIDFNAGSERLTVFCGPYNSASSQVSNEDLWETLTVWKDDVHSCSVKKIKKIKIVNILFSKTISDIYPSQQDVSGRSVRLHFDINCCVEEALNMTFGTEMTGPKVSTVSTPLVYKKGEVQQEEDGETLPCTPVSSLCRRKASVPEMHMLSMQSPALSISSKVSEPISAVRINFSKMPSDPVPKDTPKAFQTPKVPAMKSKTKVKTPVVTVTPPSKSKKKTPTKTSSTKLNNDTSNVIITSTSKTKKHIDADLLEKKTSLADPLVQLDNTDMDSIPDSHPDEIYLKDSNKIDSGTTCKKSKAKDKNTMQSLDLNPLPLSSNKTKKGKSKNVKAVKSGNTKTTESKPKKSSNPDMGKDVTNTQNTAGMPSNCSVDNPVQMETKVAKHENTEKPLREPVDSCGNLHSNSVTMSNSANDNNNASVDKDEFQVLDYFPKPMKTFSVNRKRNVETENEDGLLENHYNRKQQEITNNKQEQIKKNEMIDNKVKNKSAFDFTGDDESFKDEKTKKKQLKKQIQEKIKVPTVQLQEGVYEQNEVLETTYKDENYVEKEYAEETLVMGKSTKDRGCKVINKTELKCLKKNEKFEQTTATGKGKKGKKNDNTNSIKRSTDSDNTGGDESNIKSNKYYDYDELQPLVVEEKTQPSCDEKTLKLCSNNKLAPHKNKQGNKRGNFDKYATCEVELNVVDCELNGVGEIKKQADTCYKFSGKKMPYVIQMEENTNYEDTDVTIPCSLTIEDGETNMGTETNKCLVQGKCVKKQTTSEKCSKQRQRSKYKNENKQGNKKVNKLEESNVSEVMDQFSTENNACSKLVDKRTSNEQKKISGKIPQKLSHTNKKREKEMVETHDNDQVVLTLVCEEKQSNQTKTTKEDLMTKKTKKCQKLDPIDEDDELTFKEKSDFDSEDYCPVTTDDNHTTKPRSWFKSGKNRKASDEKQFHLHETKTSQSEEKSFQGNKKKIHTKSKSQKRIENNKNVFDFTVHELCSQNDDLERRDEADKVTTNIVKEMPTFSKCGDNTAVNLEDAIVDSIIQSTFDNSQGIEKSPPFTETKGVGMSKIGKYSLRKRNKEKLREAYKTSEDTDDEVTSINSSNEKLVNERLHLSPSDKFVQRSKLDKSKASEQLYGRKQKESNEGKNTCTVMQNKKFFHSYSSSKLNNDKSENVTSRTFKKMDSSTCFGFNSPLNKVQQSHSSKKSVLLFMSYSQSGTILPCEKGDATSDPYDFDAECNIQKTTIRTNNQSKEKRSHFTAKDDLYKTNKCKDKDDAYMTVQRKNKTNTNNYFDSQSSDNIPVFNYENDKGKKKKQRTSNMTKKYFARSPIFSDENCGANQNSFDFLKKTVVGSKTCVQRENSLQKTKSRTAYNKQKMKQKETKQKEQDNYILKLDDFSCIESPDQNIAADCSEINTEKISKFKSTSVEQNRNSTVIYQDDERDDDHSLDSQSPMKPLKKLQNKKNMRKRKNKDIYSEEDFNHIEDKMECAPKPTNSILDNFSSICKKIMSNCEDDVIYNSKEENLPVRNTKKSKMLSTPNLPITSFMKTPTTPGTAKRLYKSLDISFIKTPKTPVSEYNDDSYIDISEGLSQKSLLLMNHESDVDNNEVEEQENSLSFEKDRNQRSMDLKDKKRKRKQDTIEDKHVDDVVCSPCSTINKIISRSLASFVELEEDKLMSPVNIDENPVCGPLDKISFTDDTVKNFTRQEKLHHNGFVSGPSTTARPSKSSLKRKYSDVIDSEEEDMDLDIVDVPDQFYRPRKLFKEQRYFVEEHSFTNETVSDGSSVAFSEIAATTEVSTLLKAFGLDVQRHVKEKSQNLEFLTKAALKSSQKKIDSVWMKQQHKRSSVLEKYQCNMLQELLALEKDVSLLEKAEDNAMTFYKQQMSYLQKFRMTQDKRLSNLNDLQQGLQEEMSEIENQSSNQYAVVKAKMKENMTCMQKKLLLESQKDELNQVKRNLQTIFF